MTLLLNYAQKNEDNNLNISRYKGVLFIKLRKKLGYFPTHYPYKWLTILLSGMYAFLDILLFLLLINGMIEAILYGE